MKKPRPFKSNQHSILVVEDQPSYLELMYEAINESYPDLNVQAANNGEKAWDFLKSLGDNGELPKRYPSLIIADLNMPRLTGVDLLNRIKNDEQLKLIPVVIFSTSNTEKDILRCYQAQANCYITKPLDLEEFFEVIQRIIAFWLRVVLLPPIVY